MCGGKEEDGIDGADENEKFCSKPARVFLFIFNFIIWLGSCALLALGIYGVVDTPYATNVLDGNAVLLVAIVLISVGGIGFIISFIGCCGAFLKSKCLVLTYVIVLIILLTILLVGGILGYMFTTRMQDMSVEAMRKTLTRYRRNDKTALVKSWDTMQRSLKCCGVMLYKDWETYNEEFTRANKIPESCCVIDKNTQTVRSGCTAATNTNEFYSDVGCHSKIIQIIDEKSPYIAIIGAIVAFCMIVGVIFGIVVYTRL